jgi:hypothetical protein
MLVVDVLVRLTQRRAEQARGLGLSPRRLCEQELTPEAAADLGEPDRAMFGRRARYRPPTCLGLDLGLRRFGLDRYAHIAHELREARRIRAAERQGQDPASVFGVVDGRGDADGLGRVPAGLAQQRAWRITQLMRSSSVLFDTASWMAQNTYCPSPVRR